MITLEMHFDTVTNNPIKNLVNDITNHCNPAKQCRFLLNVTLTYYCTVTFFFKSLSRSAVSCILLLPETDSSSVQR